MIMGSGTWKTVCSPTGTTAWHETHSLVLVNRIDFADDQPSVEKITNQTKLRQAGMTTVVTTSAIAYDSDEDQGADPSDSSTERGEQHQPLGVLAIAEERPANNVRLNCAWRQNDAQACSQTRRAFGHVPHCQGPRLQVSLFDRVPEAEIQIGGAPCCRVRVLML